MSEKFSKLVAHYPKITAIICGGVLGASFGYICLLLLATVNVGRICSAPDLAIPELCQLTNIPFASFASIFVAAIFMYVWSRQWSQERWGSNIMADATHVSFWGAVFVNFMYLFYMN